jgi:signal transduction histidine kinase
MGPVVRQGFVVGACTVSSPDSLAENTPRRMSPMGWDSRWLQWVVILLILIAGALAVLGFSTLYRSPTLSFEEPPSVLLSAPSIDQIKQIDGMTLDTSLAQRLPEFFTPREESGWWRMHDALYTILTSKAAVLVTLKGRNGAPIAVEAMVRPMSIREVITRTGLVYLVAFIYILSAISLVRRHRSPSGLLLTFFLLSVGLYFISSAPIASRAITLSPLPFKILVMALYSSAGGFITLLHFALLFPRPKPILTRHPWLAPLLYGYFLLSVILYLSGLIAFGATFPAFCLLTLLMIGAFLDSLLKEKDPLFKQQIAVSLLAPVMVGGLFVLLYLLPGVLGRSDIGLTTVALCSLLLPVALPAAMDNVHLYEQRVLLERRAEQEREQIRQELHDQLCNDLTTIRLLSEQAARSVAHEPEQAQAILSAITETALRDLQCLRDFLWTMDQEEEGLEDLVCHIKSHAIRLLTPFEIDVEFEVPPCLSPPRLSPPLRMALFAIYKEAVANIIKHARARRVTIQLTLAEQGLQMRIADDGVGFTAQPRDGAYGLAHMRRRAEQIGAALNLESELGRGTAVHLILPSLICGIDKEGRSR